MEINHIHKKFLSSSGICTDTRRIKKGDFFVALRGERFDANDFVQKALDQGASCVVTENQEFYSSDRVVVVEDSLNTLQQLATFHRNYLQIPILALTGSNGKTTTKELIAHVLRLKYHLGVTQGNLNNHIGVPLTLLSFGSNLEMGIVEMGANHRKEIEALCRITHPTEGLITNIGKAHLEGFGGLDGVQKGKGELFDFIKESEGWLYVNQDEVKTKELLRNYPSATVFSDGQVPYGRHQLHVSSYLESGKCGVLLKTSGREYNVLTNLVGEYNYRNILMALAVAGRHELDLETVVASLNGFGLDMNRSQLIDKWNAKVVLDAYNANPSSMKAAIKNFFESYEKHKKILVLGDMKELGSFSQFEHEKVLKQVAKHDLNGGEVFLVGPEFSSLRDAWPYDFYETIEELKNAWDLETNKPTHVLIKGSRSMSLEQLLEIS